jgi:RNA polymerase sigma factor (sigma-70 family)
MSLSKHRISAEEVERAYDELRPLLLALAFRRFGVPEEEARNIIQDVFCDLLVAQRPIAHLRGWLIGAVANSCRSYWRKEGRRALERTDFEGWADPGTEAYEDGIQRSLLLERLRGRIPDRDATVLGWHYLEGRTAPEIAARLKVSAAYATLLIHRCLKRARQAYQKDLRPLASTRRTKARRQSASGSATDSARKMP